MNKFWFLLSSLYGSLKEYVDEQISKGGGGGSGSGLPEVTSEDNGDILSVVNGAWAKSEPGYRAAMVDGTVIIPEQEEEPYEQDDSYQTDFNIDAPVMGWFRNDDPPESLPVTFNGVKYIVPTTGYQVVSSDEKSFWLGEVDSEGKPVFTTYPFCISFHYSFIDYEQVNAIVYVPTADSFTIKIVEEVRTAIPTDDFKLAVNNSYMETTETEKECIPEQSVTTAAEEVQGISIVVASIADTDFTAPGTFPGMLHVVFDGTEYDLPRIDPEDYGYGAPWGDSGYDFTTYPLNIYFDGGTCHFYTQNAGTYTLSATYTGATTAPTEKFKEAVNNLVWTGAAFQIPVVEQLNASSTTFTCGVTDDEIYAAIARGQPLLFTFEYHGGNDSGACPAYVWVFDAEYSCFSIGAEFTRLSNNSIVSISFSIFKDEYHQCTYTEGALEVVPTQ